MTRLMKELRNRGIIYEADVLCVMEGPQYDVVTHLIDITDKVIIIGWYSAVMPSRFQLYDRFTLEPIGSQDMWLDTNPPFFGSGKMNPWDVDVRTEDEENEAMWDAAYELETMNEDTLYQQMREI